MDRNADHFVFAPDGRTLVAADRTKAISLWDIRTGKRVGTLSDPKDVTTRFAFSADGRFLASANRDGSILIWDWKKVAPPKPAAVALSREQFEGCWQELVGDDAAKAYQSVGRLIDAGDSAVAYLKDKLLDPDRGKRIAALAARLNSERFADRQRATAEIEQMSELAWPHLKAVLKEGGPLEVVLRVQKLLDQLDPPFASPAGLRLWRSLEVLEHIGTPAARDVLRALSRDDAGSPLTRAARRALARAHVVARPTE
jgi:hypothetical protein